jgi:hypothetical protein
MLLFAVTYREPIKHPNSLSSLSVSQKKTIAKPHLAQSNAHNLTLKYQWSFTRLFSQSELLHLTSQPCMFDISILFISLLLVSSKLGHHHVVRTFKRI